MKNLCMKADRLKNSSNLVIPACFWLGSSDFIEFKSLDSSSKAYQNDVNTFHAKVSMKNIIKIISCIVFIIIAIVNINGCTQFAKVEPATISDTLPTRPAELSGIKNIKGKISRVIVQIKKPVVPKLFAKQSVLKGLLNGFNKEIGKIPNTLVGQGLNKSTDTEIKLSEIYNKNSARQDVDYIMVITLNEYSSGFSAEKKEALFSKEQYASCDMEAEYKGRVRILSVPELENISQWSFNKKQSHSYNVEKIEHCKTTFKKQIKILQDKMIDNTVCISKTDYLNALASTGHVLSIKHQEDNILLETSLGTSVNAAQGDDVYFYHDLALESYAEGVIVSITSESAWVELKSLKEKEMIYLHDWVKPYYSGTMNAVKCLF